MEDFDTEHDVKIRIVFIEKYSMYERHKKLERVYAQQILFAKEQKHTTSALIREAYTIMEESIENDFNVFEKAYIIFEDIVMIDKIFKTKNE